MHPYARRDRRPDDSSASGAFGFSRRQRCVITAALVLSVSAIGGCSRPASTPNASAADDVSDQLDAGSTDSNRAADADAGLDSHTATDSPTPSCAPGTRRCSDDNSVDVQRCSAEGAWQPAPSCDVTKLQRCLKGACMNACAVSASLHEHAGCSFWTTDLDNAFVPGGPKGYRDAAGAPYVVAVVNPSDVLSATISVETHEGKVEYDRLGDPLDLSPIKPGEVRLLQLPPRNINATVQAKLAYRVTSATPVVVHQYNPLSGDDAFSTDSSVVLPAHALGMEHLILIREQSFSILRPYLTVVAVEPGTTQVSLSLAKSTVKTLASKNGTSIPAMVGGQSATFKLKQWEVLNIETDAVGADLTGSELLSTQKVAVWAGSEGSNAPNSNHCNKQACTPAESATGQKCGTCAADGQTPCGKMSHCSQFVTCCADHVEAQMPPVPTWGSHHVAVKLLPKNTKPDFWRVLAAADDTEVETKPGLKDALGKPIVIPKLNRGEWFEITSTESFEISARFSNGNAAPVLVGHFMASQNAGTPPPKQPPPTVPKMGDPALSLAAPTSRWARTYTFEIPGHFSQTFIGVAAPTGATVRVDGKLVAPGAFETITAQYQQVRMPLPEGVHTVSADIPVGVEVYGIGPYVSFLHAAGRSLLPLNLKP